MEGEGGARRAGKGRGRRGKEGEGKEGKRGGKGERKGDSRAHFVPIQIWLVNPTLTSPSPRRGDSGGFSGFRAHILGGKFTPQEKPPRILIAGGF